MMAKRITWGTRISMVLLSFSSHALCGYKDTFFIDDKKTQCVFVSSVSTNKHFQVDRIGLFGFSIKDVDCESGSIELVVARSYSQFCELKVSDGPYHMEPIVSRIRCKGLSYEGMKRIETYTYTLAFK